MNRLAGFGPYVAGLIITIAVVLLIAKWAGQSPKHFDKRFEGTTAITVISYPKVCEGQVGTERILKLTGPQIDSIISEIDMRPKRPCACAHWTKLVFVTPRGQMIVSVCNHCFNVLGGKDWELYQMPKPLWGVLEPTITKLRQ